MSGSDPEPYMPGVPLQLWLDEARLNWSDLHLDVQIASVQAQAKVYEAHGLKVTAQVLFDFGRGLEVVRRERRRLREDVDNAIADAATVDDPNPDEFADDDSPD